ncbi:MAG: hypothetical protein HZA53_19095 [Planctomycetes bacterium]|nr:hypothetical protein [Planctomycetota bacterium]
MSSRLSLVGGFAAAITFAFTTLLAPSARAQGGYTSEKKPDLGLVFPRARDYEEIPLPPSEEYVVLSYAEKIPADPKAKRPVRPEMNFVWLEKRPTRTKADDGAPAQPKEGGSTEGKEDPEERALQSIEDFITSRYKGWVLGAPSDAKERSGYKAREYALNPKRGGGAAGWVFAYDNGKRTIALVGTCFDKDIKDQSKIWRYTAEHLDITEPEEKSPAKLQLFYARKPLKGIEHRIQVRMDLVKGWKAEDTENYIVIYDTPDQPLVRRLLRDLELIRKEYEKLFPAVKPIETVSTVRVCKSKDEYLSYGGSPSTAGYWNWVDEELVFYDAEKVDKNHVASDADTFIVLYHEAFHQYIHYSTGELPPHSWFNEGTGDYFSGAQLKDGKLRGIGPMPWRVHTIQQAIGENKHIPWREMIRYEQPQYYKEDVVYICYAQGWSMIYFLRKSDEVAKRPEWAKILPTYFETLKAAYAEELAKLPEDKREDRGIRGGAGLTARNRAIEAAFEGVDLDEIEKAWARFVATIEDPRNKKR